MNRFPTTSASRMKNCACTWSFAEETSEITASYASSPAETNVTWFPAVGGGAPAATRARPQSVATTVGRSSGVMRLSGGTGAVETAAIFARMWRRIRRTPIRK
jgi:hypothetical protein